MFGMRPIVDLDGSSSVRGVDAEPPLHILLQHQHQMAATGYTWGVLAGFVGGNDLHLYRYKARPKLIADIRRRGGGSSLGVQFDEGREPPVDPDQDGAAGRAASALRRRGG